MSVGSYMIHENWPLNRLDFATWPTLPSWPAHSRHTVAYMHRFSHILSVSPEPAVWFMSGWRAVRIDHERKICGSTDHFQQFWNGYGSERVINRKLTRKFVDSSWWKFFLVEIPLGRNIPWQDFSLARSDQTWIDSTTSFFNLYWNRRKKYWAVHSLTKINAFLAYSSFIEKS